MPRIDLPAEDVGTSCVIHLAMGEHVTARLLDKCNGPVCYECFAELLNLEAKLRWAEAVEAADALKEAGK